MPEFSGQPRGKPPQQRHAIAVLPYRCEDVEIGTLSVREVLPDQRVVRFQNQQVVEPWRNRTVLVSNHVWQGYVFDKRIPCEIDRSHGNLSDHKENDRRQRALTEGTQESHGLLDGNARADGQHRHVEAARIGPERSAGMDRVKTDVETEGEMRFDEPSSAAAVIEGRQHFGVRGSRWLRRRMK